MADTRPDLLMLGPHLPEASVARLGEIATVHDGTSPEKRAASLAAAADRIRAVLTIGTVGCSAELMAALPALEIVSCFGVGFEGVDRDAARARGIVLSHGRGTNAGAVADHALALMLAVVRGVVEEDRSVRRGEWRKGERVRPGVSGLRIGLLGFGDIGRAVAARCEGGFGMTIAYHARHERPDVPHRFHGSVEELAAASDVLVVAAPGGPETHHLVDARVLDALGPDGFLVNIARGSLVDTPALIAALRERRIAGAALDVVEGEPAVPLDLLDLDNLVITPHIAGGSPASQEAMLALVVGNFTEHFAGRAVRTPIP